MDIKEVDFDFVRGDTTPITFSLKDANGADLEIAPDEIYFTVKTSYKTKDYVFQKRLSKGEITFEKGMCSLILLHKDTASLNYGSYVYDIQIKSGIYYQTICRGSISLDDESTWISNE